jgi:hypothetical protein
MIQKIGLKWIARGIVERDARDIFFERWQHLRVAVPANVTIGQYLGLGRHLVAIDPGPEERRGPNHLDGGQAQRRRFDGLLRRRGGRLQDRCQAKRL